MNENISYQHIVIYNINDQYYCIEKCKNVFEIKNQYKLEYMSRRLRCDFYNNIFDKYKDMKYDRNTIIYIRSQIEDYIYQSELLSIKTKIDNLEKELTDIKKLLNKII